MNYNKIDSLKFNIMTRLVTFLTHIKGFTCKINKKFNSIIKLISSMKKLNNKKQEIKVTNYNKIYSSKFGNCSSIISRLARFLTQINIKSFYWM